MAVPLPWLNTWYKWDEKEGLRFVVENYYDYDEGYRFDLPQNWKDKFTLKEYNINNQKRVVFYSLEKSKNIKNELLTIEYFEKNNWKKEEKKLNEKNKKFIYLGENKKTVFVAFLNNKYLDRNKDFYVDRENIHKNFKLLY
ncbi:hypothetical protein [Tepidibacter thalassicus]|uniref:Uncharacterized protein n=1 Tax=Tepidibacter thalassicus DSM 15285 TaxID=1123350 RepID=A0A1M5SY22_9FIRM|nr:hypothetical protein [Tepidibacter thalassicus]SHH43250.1 hypothetical protein SAMN02744040_01956 [Tepidibacter thalassicus DSM 15285]